MLDIRLGRFSFSVLSLLASLNVVLVVSYLSLIALVMSYAALEVEFAQSVRNNEAAVATLESSYLAELGTVTAVNYQEAGYGKPVAQVFVPGAPLTAFNAR